VSSSPQKRGLGRGLGALLGDRQVPTAPAAQPPRDAMREISVAQITPNPFQPRKHFDESALTELQSSIAEYGVLVPIIVRERPDGFELVAGERRWRACAALQRATIPAIVRKSDDRDALEVAIIENLQREDLNPIEEAAGFQQLLDEYSFTQEDLARRLGKSRPAVANTLRLLALTDGIKAMLVDGRLTAGHARALLSAPEFDRVRLAERAVREGLSVRTLERLAGNSTDASKQTPQRQLTSDEHAFESRLRQKYGTYVALRRAGKGGKIEIRFSNEKDLLRIGDLLLDEES
jgi:ParB family chromosome partitioning protein